MPRSSSQQQRNWASQWRSYSERPVMENPKRSWVSKPSIPWIRSASKTRRRKESEQRHSWGQAPFPNDTPGTMTLQCPCGHSATTRCQCRRLTWCRGCCFPSCVALQSRGKPLPVQPANCESKGMLLSSSPTTPMTSAGFRRSTGTKATALFTSWKPGSQSL